MFVFGETTGRVIDGKVSLPKEYHLKNTSLVGKWVNQNTLFLSDNSKSLNYAAGNRRAYFSIERIGDDKISVPSTYENSMVIIKGCITTIELIFINEKERLEAFDRSDANIYSFNTNIRA